MAKPKHPPLTEQEVELAKRANSWAGNRKTFALPSDSAGCQFTTKNLGDVCDQYLLEHQERILLGNIPVERDQLLSILRRYRARKAAQTRLANTKRRFRELKKRFDAAADKLFKEPERKRKAAAASREAAARASQGTLAL